MKYFKARFAPVVVTSVAALALPGCAWLGQGLGLADNTDGASFDGGSYGQTSGQTFGMQAYGMPQTQLASSADDCQITTTQSPIPEGCDPESVTIGLSVDADDAVATSTFASGGYGSQVDGDGFVASAMTESSLRKPRLRGFLQTSVERSISGTYPDYSKITAFNPAEDYDPDAYTESLSRQSGASQTDDVVYSAVVERVNRSILSNDDIYSTPATVGGGFEYVLSPRTTVFGLAGYTVSEGNAGNVVTLDGSLNRSTRTQIFDPVTGMQLDDATNVAVVSDVTGIASYAIDAADLRRIDLQAGARHYLGALDSMSRLTPFVGAAAGGSHYNGQSLRVTQRQAFLGQAFESGGAVDGKDYEVAAADENQGRVDLYDSQWVPSGQLNAGVEWQASPAFAIAFESGVRVRGGRKFTNGDRSDADVSIPLTLRGSYDF